MGLNLPKSLTALVTSDATVTRALASVKSAVDPLLYLTGSCFAIAADGTLRILRNVSNATLSGLTTLERVSATRIDVGTLIGYLPASFLQGVTCAGPNKFNGANTVQGTLVVQTLPDGTQGGLLVQGNQTVNGKFNSATGVKQYVPLGHYYTGSYATSSGYVQTYQMTQSTSNNANYLMPLYVNMPFNGSVVGISALYYGQTSAVTCNVQIRGINTVPTYTFTTSGQPFAASVSYARGAYPFTANQNLQGFVSWNSAGNQLLYVGAMVELDT